MPSSLENRIHEISLIGEVANMSRDMRRRCKSDDDSSPTSSLYGRDEKSLYIVKLAFPAFCRKLFGLSNDACSWIR